MLTERKRFNYMVNATPSSNVSHSRKKQFTVSGIKNVSFAVKEQNNSTINLSQNKQNHKKIQQLQTVNKRLLEQTTKQFKKLQSDVQRVENILEEKEEIITQLTKQKVDIHKQITKINSEKQILIQAIFQKDLVIKQYENRIQQLMQSRPYSIPEEVVQEKIPLQRREIQIQTDPEYEKCTKTQLNEAVKQAVDMQDQVYRLKEQLYDAHNKIKLMTQQFQAYKILKQIESVQLI